MSDTLHRAICLVSDGGSIVEAYDTDVYGNTMIYSAAGTGGDWWAADAVAASEPANDVIFTGRKYDAESRLYYYRFRYYCPESGKFLSRDAFISAQNANVYLYANSSPAVFVDPNGLVALPAAAVVLVAIVVMGVLIYMWVGAAFALARQLEIIEIKVPRPPRRLAPCSWRSCITLANRCLPGSCFATAGCGCVRTYDPAGRTCCACRDLY